MGAHRPDRRLRLDRQQRHHGDGGGYIAFEQNPYVRLAVAEFAPTSGPVQVLTMVRRRRQERRAAGPAVLALGRSGSRLTEFIVGGSHMRAAVIGSAPGPPPFRPDRR